MIVELFINSVIIILTTLIHTGMLSYARHFYMNTLYSFATRHFHQLSVAVIMTVIILWIILAHTMKVWIWALTIYLIAPFQIFMKAFISQL